MSLIKNNMISYAAIAMMAIAVQGYSQPNWSVNAGDFEFNMNVIGVAYVECQETMDDGDMIGAFVGEELRGIQYFGVHSNQRNYAYMFVFSNSFSGDTVHFKFYDASEDSILDVLQYVVFRENQIYGNDATPFIFTVKHDPLQLALSNNFLPRSQQIGSLISTLEAKNGKAEKIESRFEWINDADGKDNSFFEINNGKLYLKESLLSHTGDSIQLHIRIKTKGLCESDQIITLLIREVTKTEDAGQNFDADVELFPNPATDYLMIRSTIKFDQVFVFDPIKLKTQAIETNILIDVRDLNNQIYYIRFQKDNTCWNKPLIIIHR